MKRFVLSIALATAAFSALAAPTTFFGEDRDRFTFGTPGPNSVGARNAFLSNLVSGIGTETFDSYASNTNANGTVLSFPGTTGNLTATLNGSNIAFETTGPGRFPISAPNFLTATTGNFSITFATPISAFGFYGIDIGDFVTNQMQLALYDGATLVDTLTVAHSLNVANHEGATLFFGFFDTARSYTQISFTNAGGGDVFAFDNMVVGDLGQINPAPAPGTLALLGAGLLAFGLRRRKIS
jgi:hypothetical protein